MIPIYISMWLTRTKDPTQERPLLIPEVHMDSSIQDTHPGTKYFFVWMSNVAKIFLMGSNLSLNDGMGLLVKRRESTICSNVPTDIYL